jgi:hypothetical protein
MLTELGPDWLFGPGTTAVPHTGACLTADTPLEEKKQPLLNYELYI